MGTGKEAAAGGRRERSDRRAPAAGRSTDSEIPPVKQRRRYSTEYKLRILEEADTFKRGDLGVLLRREGLYHATLCKWRVWRDKMQQEHESPAPQDEKALRRELAKLERENQQLRLKLKRTEGLVELQKKAFELLEGMNQDDESSETCS